MTIAAALASGPGQARRGFLRLHPRRRPRRGPPLPAPPRIRRILGADRGGHPVLFVATVAGGHLLGVLERILIGGVLAWLTAVAIGHRRGTLTRCDRFW